MRISDWSSDVCSSDLIAGWWWGRGAIGERSEGLMGLGRVAIASGLAVVCAGCSGMSVDRDLPRGSAAYGVIPAPDAGATAAAYRIGALDVLKVTVFQEEDLSFDELQVDASGSVSVPLMGTVRAEGMTAAALPGEIARGDK